MTSTDNFDHHSTAFGLPFIRRRKSHDDSQVLACCAPLAWLLLIFFGGVVQFVTDDALAAEDSCVKDGGLATCTEPQPTDWKILDACLDDYRVNAGPIMCSVIGGTFVNGLCTNIPQIPDGQWPSIAYNAGVLQNQAWGASPCPVFDDTGWSTGTVYGFWCHASGISYGARNGIPTHGGRALTGQSCPSGSIGTRVIVERDRTLKCPEGSNTRTLGNGDLECYRTPAPRCDASSPTSPFETCGNPINVADSEKVQRETDYDLSSDLEFYRTYRSYGYQQPVGTVRSIKPLGDYWTHNFERHLFALPANPNSAAAVLGADGHLTYFNSAGNEILNQGPSARLESITGGGWRLTLPGAEVETYNSAGLLTQISQRGRITALTYSDAFTPPTIAPQPGLLVEVRSFTGSTLSFRYDSLSRLVRVINPAGSEYLFSYDGSSSFVVPGFGVGNNLTDVKAPDDTHRIYYYNEQINTSNSNLPHALTGIGDENGARFATWKYEASGGAYRSEHAGSVEAVQIQRIDPSTLTVLDSLGKLKTYHLQTLKGFRRIQSVSEPCPSGTCNTQFIYDANGNVVSRTDLKGAPTCYAYDVTRNLETTRVEGFATGSACPSDLAGYVPVIGTKQRKITTTWHSTYRLPLTITEPNRVTTYTYDTSGNQLTKTITDTTVTPNVSRTWTYTYDSFGHVLTADGPRSDVTDLTTFAYYSCTTGYQCGQLHTITDALSHVTTYNTYNASGQPLTITDPNGVVTTLTYDTRQRLTSRTIGTEQTTFEYWPTGLLKKVTLPDASYLSYVYDAAHRLTEIDDDAGNRMVYTLDAMGNHIAENLYDPSNALARTHSRVFNSLNQLWKDVTASGATNQQTIFGYDNNGNQTTINAPLSRNSANTYDQLNRLATTTDPNSGVTTFGYDANDNLTSITDPRNLVTSYTYTGFGDLKTQVSPDTATTTNTYDSGGNLSTSVDARSKTSTYTYDVLNRVSSVAYGDQTITYTYDGGTYGKGRLTGAADTAHSMSWSYDNLGRVTAKTQTIGSVVQSVGYGYTTGQLTMLTTPSGQSIAYAYANGRITSIKVNGAFLLSSVLYDPFGPVRQWTWGNGTLAVRTFDQDGRVSQIDSNEHYNYGYDNASRITGITNTANSALTWTYGYDTLDRLTSASKTTTTMGFTYDANGNRLTRTGNSPSTFTGSSTSNRLQSISGTLSRTYAYDAAGNTTSFTGVTFTYNNRGRLASATKSSVTTNYTYNALGQMIKKSNTSGTTFMVYDEAGHLQGEYTNTGALVQETIWLGDTPVATLRPKTGGGVDIFYVHADHLNTPIKVTRPSDNKLTWRLDADPFGNAGLNQNPQSLGTFVYNLRFPGQIYMSETGLNYNYFRDYDSATGTYVESDPIGLEGGINTYAYAEDDPTMVTDRLGLDTAMCTRKLSGFPFRAGPLYHQYVCVGNSKTGYSCKGLGPSGNNPFNTPGKIETDSYKSSACSTIQPDNKCVEDCIEKKFAAPPPNYSVDLSHGENCQTYSTGIVSECFAQCKAKSTSAVGGGK